MNGQDSPYGSTPSRKGRDRNTSKTVKVSSENDSYKLPEMKSPDSTKKRHTMRRNSKGSKDVGDYGEAVLKEREGRSGSQLSKNSLKSGSANLREKESNEKRGHRQHKSSHKRLSSLEGPESHSQ